MEPSSDPALRAALEAERASVAARAEEAEAATEGHSYDDNFADAAQVAAEQGESRLLYDQLRRELDDIEAALGRMDDGTYGDCEVCGQPIASERLAALPLTRRCIDHA